MVGQARVKGRRGPGKPSHRIFKLPLPLQMDCMLVPMVLEVRSFSREAFHNSRGASPPPRPLTPWAGSAGGFGRKTNLSQLSLPPSPMQLELRSGLIPSTRLRPRPSRVLRAFRSACDWNLSRFAPTPSSPSEAASTTASSWSDGSSSRSSDPSR